LRAVRVAVEENDSPLRTYSMRQQNRTANRVKFRTLRFLNALETTNGLGVVDRRIRVALKTLVSRMQQELEAQIKKPQKNDNRYKKRKCRPNELSGKPPQRRRRTLQMPGSQSGNSRLKFGAGLECLPSRRAVG
jgi:hypothetical protein